MSTGQIVIVCAAWLAVVVVVCVTVLLVKGARPALARGVAVTVHTKQPDDQTIHGVVVGEFVDRIALAAAKYITAAGDQPIPDTVVVFKANVSWVQQHVPKLT